MTLYHRQGELDPVEAQTLLGQLREVQGRVTKLVSVPTPAVGVVLYEPCGVPGSSGDLYLQTLAVFGSDGRVVFRYPWQPGHSQPGPLLGTTAHEVAEATVLGQVTVIDPYLRWVHDGIAETLEHEALRSLDVEAARSALQSNLELLEERRREGVEWVDLTRWRQVAPWLIRSHRFFASGSNLSLEDLTTSRYRVAQALEEAEQPAVRGWLLELEQILEHATRTAARPWEEGEARPANAASHDLVFYTSALAVWLHLERRHEGSIRRFLEGLRAARDADEHVLRADEALEILRRAAGPEPLPPLDHLDLSWVQQVLRDELGRLPPS